MMRYLVTAMCFCAVVSAGASRTKLRIVVNEPQAEGSYNVENTETDGSQDQGHIAHGEYGYHQGNSDGGSSYVSEAELTNLAHTSALQAKSAVQSQLSAASQAAFSAKNALAQTALGASSTAQAAYFGKRVIVQSLEHQLQEAQKQLQWEIYQFRQTQQVAAAAQKAASQSDQQVSVIGAALSSVQAGAQQAVKAAAEAAGAAAAQHSMIQEAKQRIAGLLGELENAVVELQGTEISAQKASAAAYIAQSNAASAANDVVSTSVQVQSETGHSHHFHK